MGEENGLESEPGLVPTIHANNINSEDEKNGCWSAPEYGEEDESEEEGEEDEDPEGEEDNRPFNLINHFSRSYPVIETSAGR